MEVGHTGAIDSKPGEIRPRSFSICRHRCLAMHEPLIVEVSKDRIIAKEAPLTNHKEQIIIVTRWPRPVSRSRTLRFWKSRGLKVKLGLQNPNSPAVLNNLNYYCQLHDYLRQKSMVASSENIARPSIAVIWRNLSKLVIETSLYDDNVRNSLHCPSAARRLSGSWLVSIWLRSHAQQPRPVQ